MALGLPSTPSKGDGDVCQSRRHQQKRAHDSTNDDILETDSKRSKAMPLLSPTPDDFANAWQTAEDIHGQLMTPHHPMHGSEIHFTAVDYNSSASTVEEEPVSPTSGCSQTPMPMEMTDNGQDESLKDFLFNPKIDLPVSAPFAAFPESSSSATSFHEDLFPHSQAWPYMTDTQPFMSPLGPPSGPPSSTNAVFGSPVHQSPMQIHGDFAWCYCGACRSGNPHGFHHHRHASGWRRPSSMTLPACYQNHMYSPCHDTFIAPLSAPLPPQPPAWHSNVQQQQMYTKPQSHTAHIPHQDFRTYPNQASPQVAFEWPTSPGMTAGEGTWDTQLSYGDENSQNIHTSSTMGPADDQRPTQTVGEDAQSWVHDLDAMALDASHWCI